MTPPDLTNYNKRPDVSRSSPRARSQSMSSDRPSLGGYGGLQSPPVSTCPDPAFIAASAASQIVTNDHDSHSDTWFDQHGIEPSGETALVAPSALKLVNRFLDQLLFNFLSISRSTSLASLRPAVGEVLKPKLAKDAVSGADQELQEYLGGGEDEELIAFHNGLEPSGDWDLELVWKRTRLRCMVYSSLGDMEEEDEDFYTEQDQLDGPLGTNNRFSGNSGVVSPAVAIFLTSILEFMGEQVLVVAGEAAYHRLRAKHEREERDGSGTPAEIAERVVVEESDMERVALDRTLGRLWRGWKKRIRSPTTSISMGRSFSRESLTSHSRRASISPDDHPQEDVQEPSLATVLAEHEHAACIPLPMSGDDIREIEIPGLAQLSDDEEDGAYSSDDEGLQMPPRPKSMLVFPHPGQTRPLEWDSPAFLNPVSRKRSNSLPMRGSVYVSPKKQKQTSGETGVESSGDVDSEMLSGENALRQNETKSQPAISKSLVAGIVAGAVAIGTAAAVGMKAAANGEAPQTSVGRDEETEEEEEFTEEPQIMTSSRVSIGGRISPDEAVVPSRRSSIRSHSVHSLRLIDVAAPKSPAGSRAASAEGRPASLHSMHIPESQTPRVASPITRVVNASPVTRNGSSLSSRQRNGAEEVISEERDKEAAEEQHSPPLTAVPAELAAAMSGVDFYPSPTSEEYSPQTISKQPTTGEKTSREISREPISREVTPKANSFVLAAPPPARNATRLASTSHPMSDNEKQSQSSEQAVSFKSMETGTTHLTPLRELMEGATSTSDDTSSSYDTRSTSERTGNSNSPTAVASSKSQAQRERMPWSSQPQPNGLRSSPPPSREEYMRKDSVSKVRQPRTSTSTTSSTSNKIKPVRTSEDNSSAVENKSQSFEQLIRSDQTIQYTLTPQNMRNIETPESERSGVQPVNANPHDGPRPNTSRSHSPSASRTTAAHSKTPDTPKSSKQPKTATRQPSNTSARLRPNAPQPRDARVDRESIGDFAEFIKSTGPANLYDGTSRTTSTANNHRGTSSLTKNGRDPRSTVAVSLPRRAESSAGRSKLQARDAAVPRGDSISDLIDFVRSGPQVASGIESHRIPRTVAPFRTTMDSDQMSSAVGGKAVDASLPDPRYSAASASVNSSINSQSALLANGSKVNKPLPGQKPAILNEEDMMPKRKTRRVRDMYQIDFSDEDEEYEDLTNAKPPVKEESLADFLRNVPPPPDSSPATLFNEAPSSGSKKIKKKSSTGIMSRFGRNSSGSQPPPKPKSRGRDGSSNSRIGAGAAAPKPPTHTPIAVQFSSNNFNKTPAYDPIRSNYVSQLDSARNKVAHKSYQPREAVYTSSQTHDLARFLRDSEPPPNIDSQTQAFLPSMQKEESSTFQRMFGRKKVH